MPGMNVGVGDSTGLRTMLGCLELLQGCWLRTFQYWNVGYSAEVSFQNDASNCSAHLEVGSQWRLAQRERVLIGSHDDLSQECALGDVGLAVDGESRRYRGSPSHLVTRVQISRLGDLRITFSEQLILDIFTGSRMSWRLYQDERRICGVRGSRLFRY